MKMQVFSFSRLNCSEHVYTQRFSAQLDGFFGALRACIGVRVFEGSGKFSGQFNPGKRRRKKVYFLR